jgi:dihydroneopterin aldolase
MGTVEIQGLTLYVKVGLLAHERILDQKIWIDLRLDLDFSQTAQSDTLKEDTVDYAKLSHQLSSWVAEKQFYTLEALVKQACDWILEQEACVVSIWLRCRKASAIPNTDWVACSWTQSRTMTKITGA